MNHRILK